MKKVSVNKENDFQVHAQVIHKKKSKTRKIFNYVISGFMIATTLVSGIQIKSNEVFASSNDSFKDLDNQYVQERVISLEVLTSAYHLNLKNAVRVLDSAIKNNQLDTVFFDNVGKELEKISSLLDEKPMLKVDIELNETVKFTERVLKQEMSLTQDQALIRANVLNTLEVVQNKMGIENRLEDLAMIKVDRPDTKLGDSVLIEGVKEVVDNVVDAFKPMEVEAASVGYYDLKPTHPYYKQYQWAISNGYVVINKNAKVKGKKVTMVSPNAVMVETDALRAITKYFWGKEVATTKPVNKNWNSIYYIVAQKKKLPLKGNMAKSPVLTRGQLAVLLMSAHYGKKVSVETAVQKMYEVGITSGNVVKGKYPKTYQSFGVNDKVTKSTLVLWLYNYNMNKGKLVVTQPKPPQSNGGQGANSGAFEKRIPVQTRWGTIYTHYGRTYGTKSQAEYDKAFGIIKARVEKAKKEGWFKDIGTTYMKSLWLYYKEGKRASDYPNDPIMQWGLNVVDGDQDVRYLIEKKGLAVEEVIQLINMKELSFIMEIEAVAKDPLTGEPESIYDSLVLKQYDCNTTANVYLAIVDIMGYDGLIIASDTHAETYVKVRGEWVSGVEIMTSNLFDLLEKKTHYILTPPRTGLK